MAGRGQLRRAGTQYTINGETRFTGTWGDIGTSSFYPPHHMTMGEGGCVYTNNPLLNRLILSFRDWGRDCICPSGQDNFCGHRFDGQFGELPKGYDHKYVYSHLGYLPSRHARVCQSISTPQKSKTTSVTLALGEVMENPSCKIRIGNASVAQGHRCWGWCSVNLFCN